MDAVPGAECGVVSSFPTESCMTMRLVCALCVGSLALLNVPLLLGAEWHRWRGPNGDSISDEATPLSPWPAQGPPRLWTNSVGTGFSSIVVSQGRLFTLGNSNETDTVFCLAADTGHVVWSHSYACPLAPDSYEGGPSATPAVDGDRVYTLSKFGHLFCFDAVTGTIRWQTNLTDGLGIPGPTRGFAGSPLIVGEKLLLNAGGHGLALNKTNGSVIWLSNTNRCGYSSPVFYANDGAPAIIMFSENRVVKTQLADGTLLWSHPWRPPFGMNISDILVFNGDFFITSYGLGAALLDVVGTSSAVVWTRSDFSTILSPGLLIGNYLYAFHDTQATPGEGKLACLDMTTGELAWSTNMWVGSLISADGKLIILTGQGELVLAETNAAAYAELARAPVLEGRCWTMPSLSGGQLYCRNAAGDVVALALGPTEIVRPGLQIARAADPVRLRLTWPTNSVGFQLQAADQLIFDTDWSAAGSSPATDGGLNVVETNVAGDRRFFRLRKP